MVLIAESWRDPFETTLALIVGALFAVVVELVIRAYDRSRGAAPAAPLAPSDAIRQHCCDEKADESRRRP